MSTASPLQPALPTHSRALARLRPWPVLLGLLGIALLAAAALGVWRYATAPAPYRYVELPQERQGAVRSVQLIATEGSRTLAEAEVASDASGAPLLLAWRAQVDDPLLYLGVPKEETQALAAVVARHLEPGTPVLAWWDSARQLRHWGDVPVFFDRHLGVPLFVPQAWGAQRDQVRQVEQAFWGGAADPKQRAAFDTFARALAAGEQEGVKLLRSLAPGRKALVIVHLRDLILLGQMFPDTLGVAFQDFSDSGDVHRSVKGVHGWLSEGERAAYGVIKLPDHRLRAIALRDTASAETLAARLLPLIGNNQGDVAGLTLVYRSGGYSVFELAPQ